MGEFDKSIGVYLLGLFLNTYLYGLVTYQFFVYYSTKFHDPLWIRTVVTSLCFVDTAHSVVLVYAAWEMCVTNYNKPESLALVSWSIPFTACATAVAAIITQFFLGNRVLLLTKSKILTAVIGVLSVLGFVFGMYAGIRCGIIKQVANFGVLKPFVICWLGFQTCADLFITLILTYVLTRSRTGFRKTDTIINRLIRGAIQTGLFASLFALADLFSFVLHGDTYLYAMFAFPIGRIYTNTLLDTLNSRIDLKNMNGTLDVGNDSNTYRMQAQSQTMAGHSLHSIHVKKEIVTDTVVEDRSADAKYVGDEVYGAKMV